MTKDQMLAECNAKRNQSNYDIVQHHIREAMMAGENHIYIGKEMYNDTFTDEWICFDETLYKLVSDGFKYREADYNEWEIYWEN